MTGMVERGVRLAATLLPLRPVQWVYLPLRRVQARRTPRPRTPAVRVAVERLPALADAVVGWGPGSAGERLRRADAVRAGTFEFLDRAEPLGEPDWTAVPVSRLWSYQLHYFGYGVDLAWAYRLRGDEEDARTFVRLARGWAEATADGRGIGWEPYPLAVRIVHWSHALLLLGAAVPADDREALLASLATQADVLARRIEWHLLGNHLQKDFHALAVAGLLFDGSPARRWLAAGERGLWRELATQVHPDGTHAERSPMYHAIALADWLDSASMLAAAGRRVPAEAAGRLRKMAAALAVLCRPDGAFHLFNDSVNGESPAPGDLLERAARTVGGGIEREWTGAAALVDGGFYGYAAPEGDRLLVDCGAPGPPHQPGHAHCGALGFELDLRGLPVVVDSGTAGYEGDPLREYARSTRAHSTVAIGGREQSEVWGTFRVGRRARVEAAPAGAQAGCFVLHGRCSPYHSRRAVHERSFRLAAGALEVRDRVRGAGGAPLRSWLHLHPRWEVRRDGLGRFIARSGEVEVAVEVWGVDESRVVRGVEDPPQGWYSPRFGRAVPAPVIEMGIARNAGGEFGYRILPPRTAV